MGFNSGFKGLMETVESLMFLCLTFLLLMTTFLLLMTTFLLLMTAFLLLMTADICQEGIFRRSGKMTRQQELKSFLNQGVPLNLDDGHFSVHDCASVLKNFLAELPESLLTDAHYPVYCQIAGN